MNNDQRKDLLSSQINLRIKLLNEKIAGEHLDIQFPNSLTKLREWRQIELGVNPVGSSSSFVTTNKYHGKKVFELQVLLEKLNEKKPQGQKKSLSKAKRIKKAKSKIRELNEIIEKSANQYTIYKIDIERLQEELHIALAAEEGFKEDIDYYKRMHEQLKNENISLKKEIIKLKKESNSSNISKLELKPRF